MSLNFIFFATDCAPLMYKYVWNIYSLIYTSIYVRFYVMWTRGLYNVFRTWIDDIQLIRNKTIRDTVLNIFIEKFHCDCTTLSVKRNKLAEKKVKGTYKEEINNVRENLSFLVMFLFICSFHLSFVCDLFLLTDDVIWSQRNFSIKMFKTVSVIFY